VCILELHNVVYVKDCGMWEGPLLDYCDCIVTSMNVTRLSN